MEEKRSSLMDPASPGPLPDDVQTSPLSARSQPEVLLWPIAIAMTVVSIIMATGTHHRSFQSRAAARQKQLQVEAALFQGEEREAEEQLLAQPK